MKHGIFLTNAVLYRKSSKDSYRSTYFSTFSKISFDPLSFVFSFCAKGSFQRKKQGNDDPKNRCKFPRLTYSAAAPMSDRTRSSTTETTSTYPYYIMDDNEPFQQFFLYTIYLIIQRTPTINNNHLTRFISLPISYFKVIPE